MINDLISSQNPFTNPFNIDKFSLELYVIHFPINFIILIQQQKGCFNIFKGQRSMELCIRKKITANLLILLGFKSDFMEL